MNYISHLGIYDDAAAIQAALDEGSLANPYVAYDEQLQELDWNTLSAVDNRLRVTYNIEDVSSPTIISYNREADEYDPETGDPIFVTPYNKVELEDGTDITADLVYDYGEVSYQFPEDGVYTLLFTLTGNTLWMFDFEDDNPGLFTDRTEITSVVIPETVTELGEATFSGCRNLASVNIPSGVTILRTNVFNGCHLSSIDFPDGLEEIGNSAFYESFSDWEPGDNKPDVILPESVTFVGDAAFNSCALGNVYIPSGVTFPEQIDDSPFGQVFGTLTIEEGLTEIPGMCVYADPAESVAYLPASLLEIGDNGITDFYTYHFAGTTPPTFGSDALGSDFEVIYAPCDALSAYENAIGAINPSGNEITYNCDTPSEN